MIGIAEQDRQPGGALLHPHLACRCASRPRAGAANSASGVPNRSDCFNVAMMPAQTVEAGAPHHVVDDRLDIGLHAHLVGGQRKFLGYDRVRPAQPAADLVDRLVEAQPGLGADDEEIERVGHAVFEPQPPPRGNPAQDEVGQPPAEQEPCKRQGHRRIIHSQQQLIRLEPEPDQHRRVQPRRRASRRQRWRADHAPVFRPRPEDAAASRDRTHRPPGLPRRCCRAGDTRVSASRLPPVPGREPRRATPRAAPCAPHAGRCARD